MVSKLSQQITHLQFLSFTSVFLPSSLLYCFQQLYLRASLKKTWSPKHRTRLSSTDLRALLRVALFLMRNKNVHFVALRTIATLSYINAIRRTMHGRKRFSRRSADAIVCCINNIEDEMKDQIYPVLLPWPEKGPASLGEMRLSDF